MKIHYASIALLAGASVALSSCVAPAAGYVSYSAPVSGGSISTGVAWTNASYDADGFPIFGYSYGRPVYGYTAAGAAIFTIAALTALCYVPHWGPASWYHGHYHYPHGIHRVPQPPRYPAGHAPHVRPPAGAHVGPGMPHHAAPKQPGWNSKPAHAAPKQPVWNSKPAPAAPKQPGWNNKPGHAAAKQPGWNNNNKFGHAAAQQPGRSNNNMLGHAAAQQPGRSNNRAGQAAAQRPAMGSSQGNHGGVATLPAKVGSRPVAAAPSAARGNGGAVTMPAPAGGRPIMSVPSAAASGRAGAVAAPGAGARGHHSGGRAMGRR